MKFLKTKWTVVLTALLVPTLALAIGAINVSGVNLGTGMDTIKCSTNLVCSKVGHLLTMVATSASLALANSEVIANSSDDIVTVSSDDSDMTLSIESPLTSNGDASLKLVADASADNGDEWRIQHDGATNDLLFQNDKSGSQATFYTFSEDGDVTFAGTTPYLTIGDAGAEDAGLFYNGSAADFNISLDDSAQLLVLGVGAAAGTTDAIRIDANQIVTVVQDLKGLGTDAFYGFLQKQVATTSVAITAAQCGDSFVSDSADVMDLPEASTAIGCRLTFICNNTGDFDVNPDNADIILPTGALTPSTGDAIRCTDVGSGFVLEAVSASQWAVISTNGTITDVN